jgi:hypothetical protein
MAELPFMRRTMKRATAAASRLFRNNVGQAWTGKPKRMPDGSLLLHNPLPVNFGLCKGSSDLIGFRPVTITPEMVGLQVAVFLSIETKDLTGRPTPEQRQWVDFINSHGGLAGVARTDDDVDNILSRRPGVPPIP